MAGKLKHTMVIRNPETLLPEALLEGSEVPAWAKDLVHADNLTTGGGKGSGGGSEKGKGYDDLSVAKLKAAIKERNESRSDEADHIKPAGTKQADLVAALVADDEAQAGAGGE